MRPRKGNVEASETRRRINNYVDLFFRKGPVMLCIDKCVQAENHLRFLYGQREPSDGLITIYTKKPHSVEFFSVRAIDRAAQAAWKLSEERDVYHLVNLVSRAAVRGIRARHGRGTEAELQSVVAFVCEIDTNTGSHRETDYPSQDAAVEAIFDMPLLPSVINLSGPSDGGVHVYWVLKHAVCVSDTCTRRRIKAMSKAWQERLREALCPHRLDSTFDLVRVLRVAGCRNHKYEDVVTRPVLVSGRRYSLEEFSRHVDCAEEELPEARNVEQPGGDSTWSKRCRRYLECVPGAISGQQGHNKTFRAACECFRFGLSKSEAEELMEWFNREKTPAEDKWSEAELGHKVDTAYKTVWEAGQFGMRVVR